MKHFAQLQAQHEIGESIGAYLLNLSCKGDMITQLENLPAWEDDFEDDAETSGRVKMQFRTLDMICSSFGGKMTSTPA